MANPFSLILSAGQLLRWHGQRSAMPAFIAASSAIEATTAAATAAHEATRDVVVHWAHAKLEPLL